MSKRHNWFSSSRKLRLNLNAKKSRDSRRRTLARTIQLEKFEERVVMDASIGKYPYWVNTTELNDGDWGDSSCFIYASVIPDGKTCATTTPVSVQNLALNAPDGATVKLGESADLFTPRNGLLTLATGQDAKTASYGQQQVIALKNNYFPANTINPLNEPMGGSTKFNTTIRVATTGNYTFYLTGTYNTERIKIGDQVLQLPYAGGVPARTATVVVPLTAGITYPFEALYDYGGYARSVPKKWGVEWSGPNLPRQNVTPASDVVWVNTTWTTETKTTGFIPVGATITADKTATTAEFMLRYTTSFTVPTTGEYTFTLTSNNEASLKLGNDLVLQKSVGGESSVKRTLTAGTTIPLELMYIHTTGTRNLDLQWSGPQLTKRAFVPTNPLKYEYFEGKFGLASNPLPAPKKTETLFPDSTMMALSWNGQTTPAFKRGTSAEEVQKLLNGLSNIGAVGGNVRVTYSESDASYKVFFGGTTWFRPPLIVPVGSPTIYVQAITEVPVSQRDPKSTNTIKLRDTNNIVVTDLPTAGAVPIDNAPLFTPSRFASQFEQRSANRQVLRGAIQATNVLGSFEPARTDQNFFNAELTPTGIRLSPNGFELTQSRLRALDGQDGTAYILNPLKDAAGNLRPITFLTLAGLGFEAPAGTRAKLVAIDAAANELQMVSQDRSMLVSAPFEGGRLTLELTGTDTEPIYVANMRTGIVKVTKSVRIVSVDIGEFTIPASDSFRMTYDAATDQFNFAINNLQLESKFPTGGALASALASSTQSITQSFESYGFTAAGTTYESVELPKDVYSTTIAQFEAMPNKRTGTLPFYDPLHAVPGFYNTTPGFYKSYDSAPSVTNVGVRYKGTIKLPQSGEYTFDAGWSPTRMQLKVNGAVVIQEGVYPLVGKVFLRADTEYAVEFTVIRGASNVLSSNTLKVRLGDYQSNLDFINSVRYPQLGTSGDDVVLFSGPFNYRNGYDPNLEKANFEAAIKSAIARLSISEADKTRLTRELAIVYDKNRVIVKGLPFPLMMRNNSFKATYDRVFANPVRISLKTGTISISKGNLSPIIGLGVDSFEIGQTTLTPQGIFNTVFEPLKPSSAGGYKLAFFQRNSYDRDGAVSVPGNSFGIYGNQTKLPIDVAGVKLNGLANLGTSDNPGLIITNGQFSRLTYAIPDVTVGTMVFSATEVGSAKPLAVNYFASQTSNRKSYVILGGATLKSGSAVISADMKANFGGLGSDGLRIYPDDNSFTFSFGVADTFLAGTQAIQSAPGVNGLRLVYDPKTKAYNFQGNAYLDFNPTTPHTATNLDFTGTKLEVSATAPAGVTNFVPNRLDGSTLNFFFGERASVNEFLFAPRPTNNPLRITIAKQNGVLTESVGGAFTMSLDGGKLFGVMESTTFTNARFPAAGLVLDFSPVAGQPSGYALAGIAFEDAKKSTLTDTLKLNFATAKLDGNTIAQGTAGAEPVVIEAKSGKITRAEVVSPNARQIGDFAFQNFAAKYVSLPAGAYWNITGPAVYFRKNVNVGSAAPGNPQLRIGGDPKTGTQLRTIDKPSTAQLPEFQLPETIEVAGLTLDTTVMQEESAVDGGAASKTFSIKAANYSLRVGNTTLKLDLSAKVKITSAGAEVLSFTATGVQSSAFTIGNASFQIKTLAVEYLISSKELRISGQALFNFKAKNANIEMSVTLGTKADPGLIIKGGSIESFKVTVDGSFELFKLSASAKDLTVAYQKGNQEFSIYGDLLLSTAPQGGVQVIKDLTVSLGTESSPGIKIVNGSLESLDIKINGELNLFKVTAKPEDLHITYTAAKNLVQIKGSLSITLATNFTLTAGLPGDGLLIDTDTGKVQIRGLSLRADGDISFGKLVIKGLHVDYEESESGDVTIGAAAEVQLPSGFAAGGVFKIINGRLDSIGITLERNPGILLANGLVNIYRIEASVEGLTNLDNFKVTGSVSATVGPLVKYGGQSYALADIKGTVEITQRDLKLKGEVVFVGGQFGKGDFEGVLSWNDVARVTFDAKVRLYPGDILRGTIKAYADIQGNVDFNAQMGVFVPNGIPLVGGASFGQLNVELRIRPAEEPSASYAKFGFSDIAISAFRVPTFHGSVRIGFDRLVDYSFGARFYIPLPWPLPDIDYSIDVGGRFELRDAEDPRIEILAASSLSGTPNGEILYAAATTLPDDTTIDIYADRDNLGNDGLLIASGIPFRAGTQTFVWEDMAAFAQPGEPIYVYAVISDQQHARGYSAYSPRFNAAPGFQPTVSTPTKVNFMSGDVATFSAAAGNAIVIRDPRRSVAADSELEVVFSVGAGTIDLSHVAPAVRYGGEGTSTLTVRGTADAINAAIDGLHYAQLEPNSNRDSLSIAVRALPLLNAVAAATASVDLVPGNVALSVLASQPASPATEITADRNDQYPLTDLEVETFRSSSVIGATIKINGYERGRDILGLNLDTESSSGIDAIFDEATGVLSLVGFDWTEDYEFVLQRVRFQTSSLSNGKSLTVAISDDNGEIGAIHLPLQIVAGHRAPRLNLSTSGFQINLGTTEAVLDPEASVAVADGSSIRRMVVEFVEDSYIVGEDMLSGGSGQIQGIFDPNTGRLVLSGTGSAANWSQVLSGLKYQSQSAKFTEGYRYLRITIEDDALENSETSSEFTIEKRLIATTSQSPTLALSEAEVLLPAHEEFVFLDESLSLTASDALVFEATVVITDNYIAGEDELAVTSLADGLIAGFDMATGTLTITGLASAYEYEQVLQSIIFVDTAGYRTPGQLAVAYRVFDGLQASDVETLVLTIEAAPYISGAIDNVLVYEEGRELEMIGAGLTIESEVSLTGAIVTIDEGFNPNEDELTFSSRSGISGSFNSTTGVLTLTGSASASDYESALESIGYRNTRYNPIAGERVVTFEVLSSNVISNVAQALISVEPDTVPPDVSAGGTTTYTENGAPVPIAPLLLITSKDSATSLSPDSEKLYGAQIAILNYVDGEDFLSFTPTENIGGEFDVDEGRIYFVGEGTLDEYESLLRSVVYFNTSNAPTTVSRQISIRLLDSGANGLSNQVISTEVILGLPDPVQLDRGAADDITLLTNDDPVSLGLDDLVFSSVERSDSTVELRATLRSLPPDGLGRVVLVDGTPAQLDHAYTLSEFGGLRFEPAFGALGSANIDYEVAVVDLSTGVSDSTHFTDSFTLRVDGVVTSNDAQAWAAQAYRDLVGQNPDPTTAQDMAYELAAKLKRVGRTNGFADESEARSDVLANLIVSETYRHAMISKLYMHLLARPATASETQMRLSQLASGITFTDLKGELLGSNEYFALHREERFVSYLNALYAELFERTPTDSEISAALRQLQSGSSIESLAKKLTVQSDHDSSELEQLASRLLDRDFADEDRETFDFSDQSSLRLSILSSDEYYERSAVTTGEANEGPQTTSDFAAVGKLGDIAGDKAGGTLIAPQYVLVAAHSVVGLPPGQLTFTIGDEVHRIANVFVHPEYSTDSLGDEDSNDVAILKLDSAVSGIVPLTISGKAPRLGDQLELVGFGQQDGLAYGTKRVGATPPVDFVGDTIFRWTHKNESQNDSDPGDSGSPLLVKVGERYEVIGIVSGGMHGAAGQGDVSSNVRIDKYLTWIRSVVPSITTADTADAPSLMTEIEDFYLDENAGLQIFEFQVSSDGEVIVSVSTDKPQMFQSLTVEDDGRQFGRILFETSGNQRGTAKIFVTATTAEGSTVETISVTTEERNDPPTMGVLDPITVDRGSGPQSVQLEGLSAGTGETGNVRVTIRRLYPQNFFTGVSVSQPTEGGEFNPPTLYFTPAANQVGTGVVELELRDSGPDGIFNTADDQTSSSPIVVTTSLTKAPTLDPIAKRRFALGSSAQSIPLTGIGSGDASAQPLKFSVTSSNPDIALLQVIEVDTQHAASANLAVLPLTAGTSSVTVRVTDPGDDGQFETFDDRWSERAFDLVISDSNQNWHNVSLPHDVNADGEVSPLDALLVVNYLNQFGASHLPVRSQPTSPFVDTNGDGDCSPIDALGIVDWLSGLRGEGEQSDVQGIQSSARADNSRRLVDSYDDLVDHVFIEPLQLRAKRKVATK